MSRSQFDELRNLWEADPRQITVEEAMGHSIQSLCDLKEWLEVHNIHLEKHEDLIKMLLRALQAQERTRKRQNESWQRENQALQKAIIALEKLSDLRDEELIFEIDLSQMEFQLEMEARFEAMEAKNSELLSQLGAINQKLETLQSPPAPPDKIVIELVLSINSDDQTVEVLSFTKGGDKNDDNPAEV